MGRRDLRELVRRLNDAGTRVLAVVDRNPRFQADGVAGLPCLSPDELLSRAPAAVALGMHNGSVADLATLVSRLQSSGFDTWLPQRRAAAHSGRRWPAAFWLTPILGQQDPQHALDEARTVLECFADEASARVFWGELCARALDKARGPRPKRGNMRPRACRRGRNPFAWSMPAPTTATRPRLRTKWHKDRAKPLFRTGSGQLRSVAGRALRRRRMMCWPLGLSDRTKSLRFHAGNGTASRASEDGDTIIQCVALDETAPHFPATLLKMDIEGAELDAARCRKVDCTPGCAMAISAYHTPDHLESAASDAPPSTTPSAVRAHAYGGFETVAYALPPEVASHLRTAAAHGGGHAIR